ncbi:MAG: FAD-binding oxidoreductase [Deltaproteobacteria bacterium]|nr:FAD-binding oxidoreductase [Deltaproteobacteria bacterium]
MMIHTLLSTDPDKLTQFSKDAVYAGAPQYAYAARDFQETAEVIAYCRAENIPVTFCGSQTSMTGASVADSGLALSLTAKNKIIDIGLGSDGAPYVVTEPGVVLADLKKAVLDAGYYYPPDPTSFNEAQVGATIATNATGEDTYKYGPTRRYVEELELILANGTKKTIARKKPVPQNIIKNTAGYFMDGEEIDEVIGSEGTLALISKIRLRLLKPDKKNIFVLLLPFSDFDRCIRAVLLLTAQPHKSRALELVGPGAAEIFKSCKSCPNELKNENCFLYIKDEYAEDNDFQKGVYGWFCLLNEVYRNVDDLACFDRIFLAKTDEQLKSIHDCRHHVPLKVNETCFEYIKDGGGKVGTDWWVPLQHLYKMMTDTHTEAQLLQLDFLVFAHIGNGHPHWNFLTQNKTDHQRAIDFVKKQGELAVRYGGGVAGEHGIGKIKKYLMAIQHRPAVLNKMRAIKKRWDPDFILGRGNIF